MFTLVIQTNHGGTFDVVCEGSKIFDLLLILEGSDRVKGFKVMSSDSGQVTSLYSQFGFGSFSKFVSNKFQWG